MTCVVANRRDLTFAYAVKLTQPGNLDQPGSGFPLAYSTCRMCPPLFA